MKISQMLLREDFYEINLKTLSEYFKNSDECSLLYVYPELNAIITAKPSKKVKQYLMNEYSVKSNPVKAFLVKFYVKICLCSRGILAAKKIRINNNMTDDMLIYPCNKKYRIFDFAAGSVDVIAKSGFPQNDLLKEIEFRTKNSEEFIPELIDSSEAQYSEKIIDGMPLARLSLDFEKYQKLALDALERFSDKQQLTKFILSREYTDKLLNKIKDFSINITKNINKNLLTNVAQELADSVSEDKEIKVMLSHGDLQPGNIWIEKTGSLYIIDWETWDVRSDWYDNAVLYKNLRNGGIKHYFESCNNKDEAAIVCLEDIIYRLNELNNLPFDYGEEEFEHYLNILASFQKG